MDISINTDIIYSQENIVKLNELKPNINFMKKQVPFDFNLKQMNEALASPVHEVPDNLKTIEDFDKWINGIVS
jgi:hypothetical protein